MVKKGFVLLEHIPGTRNRKVIRLSEEGIAYGKSRVMWIFEAEQKAMEETKPHDVQVCISMLEKYIANLKKEFSDE